MMHAIWLFTLCSLLACSTSARGAFQIREPRIEVASSQNAAALQLELERYLLRTALNCPSTRGVVRVHITCRTWSSALTRELEVIDGRAAVAIEPCGESLDVTAVAIDRNWVACQPAVLVPTHAQTFRGRFLCDEVLLPDAQRILRERRCP